MSRTLSILRAANPIAALFGPLFQKEVRTAGRRRSTYIVRFLYCLGLLVILLGAFFVYRSEHQAQSAALNLQSMQQLAPTLTLVVGWFQFAVLLFISPILAAGSVCDERRARSLDVLMTTPMAAGQIVLGKLSSRIVQMVILTLLAAPGLLAVRVFGGLSAEVIIATSAIAISTAILGASLSILFSVRQKRATIAALFGFLSLLLLQGAPAIIEGIRFYAVNQWAVESPYRANILATCSPATMAELTDSVISGKPTPRVIIEGPSPMMPAPNTGTLIPAGAPSRTYDLGPMWALNALYNLTLAAIVTFYTTLVLRRAMKGAASREGLLAPAALPPRTRKKKEAAPAAATDTPADPEPESAAERYRTRDRQVADNPVLWREVRQPSFGSRIIFRAVFILTILGLALLYWQAGLSDPGLHAALAYIACIAVMFQAVFLTSGPFAGEREARTWDVLLTTTLKPRQILLGKYLGSLRGFWFIPTVVILHCIIAAAAGYLRPIGILFVTLILVGPALLFTATGLLLSLRFKKAVTAGALNLALALILWAFLWLTPLAIPPTLRALLWLPGRLGLFQSDLVVDNFLDDHFMHLIDGIYALNPIALMGTALTPSILEDARGTVHIPFNTGLIQSTLDRTDCTLVVLAVFACYSLTALAILALARSRFRAWSGRAS